MRGWGNVVAGAAFIIAGGLFALMLSTELPAELSLAFWPRHSKAKVVEVAEGRLDAENDRQPTRITFVYDIGGRPFVTSSLTRYQYLAVEGATVDVEVSRLRSSWARIVGTSRLPLGWFGALFPIFFMAFGGFAALLPFLSVEARTRRALRRAPLVPIANAREGSVVKIRGRVRLIGVPLRAPLSGRSCAAYSVSIEECGSESNSHLFGDAGIVDFLIEDEGAVARVQTSLSAPALALALAQQSWDGDHPAVRALLEAKGISCKSSLECSEAVLEEGAHVVVSGICSREIDPTAATTYRIPPVRLALAAPRGAQLLIADTE